MRTAKLLAMILTIAMIGAALLAGCSVATPAPTTAPAATVAATAEATPTPAPTPTPEAKPVTITIAAGFANFVPVLKQLGDAYKVDHPNVSLDIVADGTTDYFKALQAMIAAGNYPEIALIPRGTPEKQFVDNGLLMDLTDRPVASLMSDLNKQTHQYNGKIYSVSTGAGTYGLIYNKDVFAACGIANPPKTLTELKSDCAIFTSKGYTPFLPMFKTDWACGQFFQYGVDPALDENPGLIDNIIAGKAKMTDANSPMLGVFGFLQVLKDNAGKNPFNFDTFGNSINEFAGGKVAMAIHGDWLMPPIVQLDKTFADKVGMVGIPWSDDASQNKLVVFYNDGYGIFANSKNVDEGTKFFDYFFQIENQNILAKATGSVSPMKGADTSFAYAYTQQIMADEQNPDNVYGDLEFSKLPQTVTPEMNSAMQGYLAGTMTSAQVLEKLQNAMELGLQNK